MQPTTLLDNLNSDLLAAFSALLPKSAAQRVLVYVESDEDIAFWRSILMPFEGKRISFDIQLPIKNALEKGKSAALEKSQELLKISVGTHLIICVDSDYDYLLQEITEDSKKINSSDFIFQTYAYSIENLLCFSESLHTLCVQSTKNDNRIIDIEELVNLYSQIIYKLFLWSIHFKIKQDSDTFPLSNFCETVKILDKVEILDQCKTALNGLIDRVNVKLNELEHNFPSDIARVEELSERLQILGLNRNNTYLFAQGHLIKDNVILMFLKPICRHLKQEKENQIKSNANHNIELSNQMNFYKKQIVPIEVSLTNSTEYKSCFLYLKLHEDITKYVKKLEELNTI